jgi:ABC-type glycerol-3-phosphate transport system permease component
VKGFTQPLLPVKKKEEDLSKEEVFFNYWNDFLYVLVVTTKSSMRTLPVGLATLQTPTSTTVPLSQWDGFPGSAFDKSLLMAMSLWSRLIM